MNFDFSSALFVFEGCKEKMSLFSFGFKKTPTKNGTISCGESDKENESIIDVTKIEQKRKTETKTETVKPLKRQKQHPNNIAKRRKTASSTKIKPTLGIVEESKSQVLTFGEHTHNFLGFLNKENIRDKRQRPKSDVNYDESTLWISPSDLKKMKLTPAMKIWWNFKIDNFDTVLFFKVGKFYELYHMDSDIAVKELNLLHMKGKTSHCGFPETSFSKFANRLINLGYKVARIEQVETPAQMRERTGKSSGCVKRALCRVLTPGTRTLSERTKSSSESQSSLLDGKVKLLCLHQQERKFHFVLLDPTTAKLNVDSFLDDSSYGTLKTILLTESPAEILFLRNNLDDDVLTIIKTLLSCQRGTRGCSILTAISPQNIKTTIDDSISSSTKAKIVATRCETISSLCFEYLKRCKIYDEVVGYDAFSHYFARENTENSSSETANIDFDFPNSNKMTLDALALVNLDIVGNREKTNFPVFKYINHCCTKFGTRNLRKWLLSPLCEAQDINKRLDAIEVFNTLNSELRPVRKQFHKVGDVERLLSKCFALGQTTDEAVIYEADKVEKKKLHFLITLLTSLKLLLTVLSDLKRIISTDSDVSLAKGKELLLALFEQCCLTEVETDLIAFETSVESVKQFLDTQDISENPDIVSIRSLLEKELDQARENVHPSIKFWTGGVGDDRFQLEVTEKALPRKKSAPNDWYLKTTTKGKRRFHTARIKSLVEKLIVVENEISSKGREKLRETFSLLDDLKFNFFTVLLAGKQIDCLWALSVLSLDSIWCRPKLLPFEGKPQLIVTQARHPVVAMLLESEGKHFVENDIKLENIFLLTGSNMGGKSTLIRQVCIIAILAQIGSFVPAASCATTIFDRVFTRAGAKDCILKGQSTFAVELFETKIAIDNATERSLVAMDELGRGTSTFDGSAIAYAVLLELARKKCAAIFSTHYFDVVSSVKDKDNIRLKQMKCIQLDAKDRNVTFLYTLVDGCASQSHGANVGELAGLPKEVLMLAEKKTTEFLSKTKQ